MTQPQQPLNALLVRAGDGKQDAVALGDGIFMSRDISNFSEVRWLESEIRTLRAAIGEPAR